MVIGPIEPVINDRGSKIMRQRKRGGDRGAAGRRGREAEEGKRAKKPPPKKKTYFAHGRISQSHWAELLMYFGNGVVSN